MGLHVCKTHGLFGPEPFCPKCNKEPIKINTNEYCVISKAALHTLYLKASGYAVAIKNGPMEEALDEAREVLED